MDNQWVSPSRTRKSKRIKTTGSLCSLVDSDDITMVMDGMNVEPIVLKNSFNPLLVGESSKGAGKAPPEIGKKSSETAVISQSIKNKAPLHRNIAILDQVPTYATAVYMTSVDNEVNLGEINHFALRKAIDVICGNVKGIRKCKSGSLLIEAQTNNQVQQLMATKAIIGGQYRVKVELASDYDTVQGMVFAPDLLNCDISYIARELEEQRVLKVRRLHKGKDRIPTHLLVMTFGELAGKAENVLNKIDSDTASIFSSRKHYSANQTSTDTSLQQIISQYGYMNTSSSSEERKSGHNIESKYTYEPESVTSKKVERKTNKQHKEELLIEFLNTGGHDNKNSAINNISQKNFNESLINESSDLITHSMQSSLSSVVSGRETPESKSLDTELSSGSGISWTTEPYVMLEQIMSEPNSQSSTDSDSHSYGVIESASKYSKVVKECELLKKEVTSLNQEMNQVLKRAKDAEKEGKRIRAELEVVVTEGKNREWSLRDELSTKENDVASLSLKSQTLERRILENENIIRELQQQNKRLSDNASMSNGEQSQIVLSLQEKLKESEAALKRQLQSNNLEAELNQRLKCSEEEKSALMESLSKANEIIERERNQAATLVSQISSLQDAVSASSEELATYKAKAERILQSKDKLIRSLKEATPGEGQEEFLKEEFDQVRTEKDFLREELEKSSHRLKYLTREMADAEALAQQESQNTLKKIDLLQEDLEKERRDRRAAEDHLRQLEEEAKCLREELTRKKINLTSQLQGRDSEIERLQKQIAYKQSSSDSVAELEKRIHDLTESLIMKQTAIELLSTDKHSLQIQIANIQEQQFLESQNRQTKDITIDQSNDEVRNRGGIPTFLMESPFDGGVTRRVKRVYGTMDKFSGRVGVFLRRFPIARVFVLCYICLLHLWVFVVLLTYKPEIHGAHFLPHTAAKP